MSIFVNNLRQNSIIVLVEWQNLRNSEARRDCENEMERNRKFFDV